MNLLMVAPPILPAESGNTLLAKANLSIPADERLILGISLSRTRLAAGACVFEGESDRVLFIEKGLVLPMILMMEGNSLALTMVGSEGAVGMPGMNEGGYGFQYRALTAVEAQQISARALSLACSRSRELDSLLRTYSQTLFSDSIITMACHFHHDLHKKVPRWLLMAADRLKSNRLPLTQEILAEAHGVTQGAISRVLDALESKKLVERTRKEITVLSRKRLRSTACRCYSAIDQGEKNIVKTGGF